MAVVTILLPLDVKPTNNPWFLGGLWECPLIDNHWHKGGRDLFQVAYRPIDHPGGFVRAPPNAARLGRCRCATVSSDSWRLRSRSDARYEPVRQLFNSATR